MPHQRVFVVHEYQKKAMSDSETIRSVLWASAEMPERTLVFNGRDWHIDEAILLPPNTTVFIDGCAIIQNDGVFDNVFRGANLTLDPANPYGFPLDVKPLENVRILGQNGAKITGCEKNRQGFHPVLGVTQDMTGDFWGWRTLMISLSLCDGFEVAGLDISRTRCWAMSFDMCSNGSAHDLAIRSDVKNGDGVNFRAGCHHCSAYNIEGFTSDDTVACTALLAPAVAYPHRNYLYPLEPTRTLYEKYEPRALDIHHIRVSDIRTGGRCHGVICLAAGGAQVYEIDIEDVRESEEGHRASTVKLYTGYYGGYNEGDLHDIRVRGVTGTQSDFALECNCRMENVVFEDIAHNGGPERVYSVADWQGIRRL